MGARVLDRRGLARRAGARRRLRFGPGDRAAPRAQRRTSSPSTPTPAMVAKARETLPAACPILHQDLLDLELDEPVDAVFSSAVFHWITDHERLFARLHAALKPGGRLIAQCGGHGNIAARPRGRRRARRAPALRHPRGDRGAPARRGLRARSSLARAHADARRRPARPTCETRRSSTASPTRDETAARAPPPQLDRRSTTSA